jgi:hypothetical protein
MIRQMAFWPVISVHNSTHHPRRKATTKRSEKRQRTERITVRLLPSERAQLAEIAQFFNISEAELVRWTSLHYLRMHDAHLCHYREVWTNESR